jgi:hypothetical protein
MGCPREAECKAKAAGAGGELANVGVGPKTAVLRHLSSTEIAHRLKGADEYAPSLPFRLASYIHAKVLAIDGVNIGVAGRTENYEIAWSGSTVRVRGWVWRRIVRTEIGLNLDDAANNRAVVGPADQQLAKQARRNVLSMSLKE